MASKKASQGSGNTNSTQSNAAMYTDRDDTIRGTKDDDTLFGGHGDDKIFGESGNDSLQGDEGNDALYGGAGIDTLLGGDGDDQLFGGGAADASESGRELLDGGAGDDQIQGGNGDEDIFGGDGEDDIHGGNGDDIIHGGGGADNLHGGNGADYFVYTSLSDSSATRKGSWDDKNGDTITSFKHGGNKIDLRELPSDSGLHWSDGDASEYGVWFDFKQGSTYVYADTDGDEKADLAIRLKGKVKLEADDVLLSDGDGDPDPVVLPIAVDDTGEAVEEGVAAGSNAAGNVITGAGADSSPNGDDLHVSAIQTTAGTMGTVGAALAGDYGTLTLNADGSYNYAVNNANVTVNALNGSESLTDSFTYTIADEQGGTATATLTISVLGANDAPVVDSHNGADQVTLAVDENTTAVTSVHATDPDHGAVVSYSITGGADADAFMVDAVTGALSFRNAPDFEAPGDADGNNSYEVTVTAQDGLGGAGSQTFTVTINDLSEYPVTAPIDIDTLLNSVDENASAGTVVGLTAQATDIDGDAITYLLTDDAGGRFAIDASTGVVTTTGAAIDRESDSSFAITVRATSADGSSADAIFTIGVNDVDEFDVTVPIDVNAAANVIDENLAVGSSVGITVLASDADATTNGVTYSLVNDAGGLFAIDTNTGVVTTAGAIDYEAAASHTITVRAASEDGSTAESDFTISVNDLSEYPVTAPIDIDALLNNVDENAAAGTVLGLTAQATDNDGDAITYSLTDDAGGRFAINASTGVVTTTGAAIDRESDSSFAITVRATSTDGSSADATFTIGVNDVDEFDVTVPIDTNAAANNIDENVAIGTAVGLTAFASDADATTNGVTYSLVNDAGGLLSIDANTGIVTTAGAIDFETSPLLNLTIRATSEDGSTADADFTVTINDLSEYPVTAPVDFDGLFNNVDENAAAGTVVGLTAQASDGDGDAIAYSLTDDAGGRFTINADTGVVTTTGAAIDRESDSSFDITVRATSADGSHAESNFTLGVNDVDEYDVTAPVDTNGADNAVNENVAIGTKVGISAFASDADATTNGITYSLLNDAGGLLSIDADTGVVSTAAAIDFETTPSLTITVRATSEDGSTADSDFTITVNDITEHPVAAPIDINAADDSVDENAAAGTLVGITAQAQDVDGDAVTYSLTDDAEGHFQIDVNTGVVTTTGLAIDRETESSFRITVRATSEDGSTAESNFTLGVNDVDEFDVTAPIDTRAVANAVDEDAAAGTLVGITAEAVDADATNNGVTYSLADDAGGRFSIDAINGYVRTTGVSLDYAANSSHDIVVRATSEDGSTADSVFTIDINPGDSFNVSTPVDTDAAPDAVDENVAAGTRVGITAFAEDLDLFNNGVTYRLLNDADGRFAIDANTGVVTTTGAAIDREDAASYTIVVRADSEDGSSANQGFTIAVNDLNEFAIAAPVDDSNATNAVDEMAAAGTLVGITALAIDADATTNAVTYELLDDAGGRFTLDTDTGVVTTTGVLIDYETDTSFDIVVRATSEDGSSAESTFTIGVNDVVEYPVEAPVDVDATDNNVDENSAAGVAVGITAQATDPDAAPGSVTYSLVSDGSGRFAIDATTGVVTTTGLSINYEVRNHYDITVRATSTDSSFADTEFTIAVNDVNDIAPNFTSGSSSRVDENIDPATVIYDAEVTDPDGDSLTFSLSGDDAALFSIDAATGEIRFLASPDYETPLDLNGDNNHKITIHAFDGAQEETRNVSIIVEDVFEAIPNIEAPVFTSGNAASMMENTANTVVVYDADVTDPDGDAAIFSLSGADAARFTIDAATGELRFLASPDYEAPLDADFDNNYDITVHAFDGVHDSTQDVTVTVTDAFEPGIADPNDFDFEGSALPSDGSGVITTTNNDETVVGSDLDDTISTKWGADTVYARAGNDYIDSSNDFDLVYGQAGNDTINAGTNSDTIYGGSGNDLILASRGNDLIYGGSGNDTINLDTGRESVIGGYGADTIIDNNTSVDTFIYLSTLDTGDTIVNFSGANIFDLSAIDANTAIAGNDAFTFIATQTSGIIANSVTWHQVGGNTYIHADVNGDSISDLDITLDVAIPLAAGMFIL